MSSKIAETRRRDRSAIARDNEVAIAQKDLEARQQTLTIERTKKEPELSQSATSPTRPRAPGPKSQLRRGRGGDHACAGDNKLRRTVNAMANSSFASATGFVIRSRARTTGSPFPR